MLKPLFLMHDLDYQERGLLQKKTKASDFVQSLWLCPKQKRLCGKRMQRSIKYSTAAAKLGLKTQAKVLTMEIPCLIEQWNEWNPPKNCTNTSKCRDALCWPVGLSIAGDLLLWGHGLKAGQPCLISGLCRKELWGEKLGQVRVKGQRDL